MKWLAYLVAALCAPLLLLIAGLALALEDLFFLCSNDSSSRPKSDTPVRSRAASIVIPTWNGRDLLEKYLPSVIRATREGHPDNEIIVVDNASADGTAEFLARHFPSVRVLQQEVNLGFGGGSNAGFRAARNDIVVLLNNDMRVDPDFLPPLLEPFDDPLVFAVACQIFLGDASKRREETGLTETWWERGRLVVSHRIDNTLSGAFPCAYAGGGSSAFDRRKFFELGGFDELLRPFYFEDTDLGFMAWKRGWKVLYQPRSVVVHEHRGTIGKKFNPAYIETVCKTNSVLFCWKNIHDPRMLAGNLLRLAVTSLFGTLLGKSKGRRAAVAVTAALPRLPHLMRSRWRARELARIADREAFRRQRGGYFRDRFESSQPFRSRLQVLFVSPYAIEPPTHGGAVFMKHTLEALAEHADVHLLSFVDAARDLAAQESLRTVCASAEFLVRKHGARNPSHVLRPRVVDEFFDPEFAWMMDRIIFTRKIDVVQIDYTMLGQYAGVYGGIPCFLFEHDISFQSLGRRFQANRSLRLGAAYMQVLRYELEVARCFARIQVCSKENEEYLLSFAPQLAGRIDADLRAAIDTGAYRFTPYGREPGTILFIGSFNHHPNVQALTWFLDRAWPLILQQRPDALLIIAGSGSAESLRLKLDHPRVRHLGFVEDVQALLQQEALFICPILSGSGVRVKLLEAFASGIPVVSTTLGAEGLAHERGQYCELADTPEAFADSVLRILSDPDYAAGLALRARHMVEQSRDSKTATAKLMTTYLREVALRRPFASAAAAGDGLLTLNAASDPQSVA